MRVEDMEGRSRRLSEPPGILYPPTLFSTDYAGFGSAAASYEYSE
jgi:hypothetical protein